MFDMGRSLFCVARLALVGIGVLVLTISAQVRRITLEQVKQQSANRLTSPASRLGQLSVEAAKQHRLAVQADYFPKFGATFANLHYTEFLGQLITVRRPLAGSQVEVPIPIFSQNATIAMLAFTQPITPLLEVRQAVRVARADERIAMAKASLSVARNTRDREVEETYFKLLIAQLRLLCAGSDLRVSDGLAAADTRQLTVSLNRLMGWPEDTELELVPPEPLVENISLEEAADRSVATNPEVIEAEQTVVKARAGAAVSKLAYVPTVALVGGYLFQNAIPSVPSNFGYGGVMASYNLFDFGKREHTVKEARTQLEMAELALQMTKAKVAADVKKSYFELERARQLSRVATSMGSSMAVLMKASTNPESADVKAARAEVEVAILEADLAHRQAFDGLMAMLDSRR